MSRNVVISVTTSIAIVFMVAGGLLIFFPQEISREMFGIEAPFVLVSLLGAAIFGMGQLNWMSRYSLLGGIYGKAVTMGNFVHMAVAAITLVRYVAAGHTGVAWLVAAAFYVAGAVFYGRLGFRPPDLSGA